ncbi:MAG: hypothetical protein ABI151_01990 [Chitinophagaceae bacterium]
MRPSFILFIFVLLSAVAFGQVSDFISVKKRNNITVRSFFPGTYISCKLVFGEEISGLVHEIKNDSVFIREFDIQAIPNPWGTYTIDTLGSHVVAFHYRDIATVVLKKRDSFSYVKNGTLLMIGGIGYAALNVINGKYLKESITGPENRKSLGTALGVAGAGLLLNRLYARSKRFDTKYHIVYTCMTCPKLKPF